MGLLDRLADALRRILRPPGDGGGGSPPPRGAPEPVIWDIVLTESDESTVFVEDGRNVREPSSEERVDDGEQYHFTWGVKNEGARGEVVIEILFDGQVEDRFIFTLDGGEVEEDNRTRDLACCSGDTDNWRFQVYESGNKENGEAYSVIVRQSDTVNGGF